MPARCETCPLKDPMLVERFCSQCRMETLLSGKDHRFHTLGMILYRAEEFAAAADAFVAAREHSQGFPLEAVFNLSLALTRRSKYDEALAAIDEVIRHDPLAEAVYVKGLILRYLQRWDEAEASLKTAKNAGYEKADDELVNLRIRRDMETAESDAIADDPEKQLAYLTGRLSGPEPLSPRHEAYLLTEAGDAARRLGDNGQARRYYTTACQTDLSADTAAKLAEFVLDHGAEEEAEVAETWLWQALALEGSHGRAHLCLGRVQRSRGQLGLAFRSMLNALRANPTDEYVILETAEAAADFGDVPYCLTLLSKLDASADSEPYWRDRARTLRRSIGAY